MEPYRTIKYLIITYDHLEVVESQELQKKRSVVSSKLMQWLQITGRIGITAVMLNGYFDKKEENEEE